VPDDQADCLPDEAMNDTTTSTGTTSLNVTIGAGHPDCCTMTVSSDPDGEIKWTYVDFESAQDHIDSLVIESRRDSETIPLWMVLHLPNWVCSLYFWMKKKLNTLIP
jgi:hypothetical protein